MTATDIPDPQPGTGADAGALHFARHVVTHPDPLYAARRLQDWIADRIGGPDEPHDFGRLYVVFAELGDVESMFGHEQTAAQAVRRAADEWLRVALDADRRASWFDEWGAWLRQYSRGR